MHQQNMTASDQSSGGEHRNLMSYLRQADATFRNGFESDDLKEIFLNNTFEEIRGEETALCTMKSASFILENMIKESNIDVVAKFYKVLLEEGAWLKLSYSQGGCHVIEALSERVISLLHLEKTNDKKRDFTCLKNLLPPNEEDLINVMTDTHATHSFRSHIQMLGGVNFSKRNSKKQQDDIILPKGHIPPGYLKMFQGICRCICEIHPKKFVQLLSDAHACPCIAYTLKVANMRELPKTLKRLCKKIVFCCQPEEDTSTFFILMKDKNGSHVLEALLQYGNEETKELITDLLTSDQSRFFELCSHPVANFVVQRMLPSIRDETKFDSIFKFISEGLEDIFADQNYGIVLRVAESCLRFKKCQETFVNKLLEAFHCDHADTKFQMVSLLATLTAREGLNKDSEQISKEMKNLSGIEYHGSVLLQTLLEFENIGLIIKSLCEIPAQHIVSISCDMNGSHFVDAFFKSSKVKLKKKREILERLKHDFHSLACDKYGSRVLENVWNCADINEKKIIAENLSPNSKQLAQDQYGKFIVRNFNLTKYETRRNEWEEFQKQATRKRKMFASIVSDSQLKNKRLK